MATTGGGKAATRRFRLSVEEALTRLECIYGRPRRIARFTPMDELVSCILSQSSADKNSFPAFTNLVSTLPTWDAIARAPESEVAELIRRAGLANQKAKHVQGALRAIHAAHGDYTLEPLRALSTDDARAWLEKLPGVGPKTASIVLCFAMGRDAIPVDTHVFRISWRLGLIREEIGERKAHDELRRVAKGVDAFRFHVDLIQHGRMICHAKSPDCGSCPLEDACWWRRAARKAA